MRGRNGPDVTPALASLQNRKSFGFGSHCSWLPLALALPEVLRPGGRG